MRVLAVDPGQRRIGLAVSDPTGTVARPLTILEHRSTAEDAQRILLAGGDHGAEMILVGIALDSRDEVGPQARRALRLVAALREAGAIRVATCDESFSSQVALGIRRARGASRRLRDAPSDALAAAVILQEYLDAQAPASE